LRAAIVPVQTFILYQYKKIRPKPDAIRMPLTMVKLSPPE